MKRLTVHTKRVWDTQRTTVVVTFLAEEHRALTPVAQITVDVWPDALTRLWNVRVVTEGASHTPPHASTLQSFVFDAADAMLANLAAVMGHARHADLTLDEATMSFDNPTAETVRNVEVWLRLMVLGMGKAGKAATAAAAALPAAHEGVARAFRGLFAGHDSTPLWAKRLRPQPVYDVDDVVHDDVHVVSGGGRRSRGRSLTRSLTRHSSSRQRARSRSRSRK